MKNYLSILLIFLCQLSQAQNEFAKWYFGNHTGLDFMTTPPSVINHTTMNAFEGCASVANGAGNLLFYTDGGTVWNQQQLVMANGTGLMGNGSTVQSALIVKQPGNNTIYYVFTLAAQGYTDGLRYSLVDMSLAAGMGSVTIKNIPVSTPCTEQLTGVRHCNGVDTWIVTHDFNSNNFQSFLLTSAGLSLTPVISSIGSAPPTFTPANLVIGQGTIKISPSGKKLGLTFFNGTNNSEVSIFDFDKSTGVVSNSLALITGSLNYYGCEFSGDGTKFYSGSSGGNVSQVLQWDLCAGSNAQILASQTTVGNSASGFGQLQMAPNGKIYVVGWNAQVLSAINNPDAVGPACNYVAAALSVANGTCGAGLPNFLAGVFKNLPAFTYTLNGCGLVSFTAPPNPTVNMGCGASAYPVQGISWDFGQPLSGTANTATVSNPTHSFGSAGIYTVKLVFNYACGADTVYQNLTITGPTITVASSSITCTTPGTATVNVSGGLGPFTYNWLPIGQTTSVVSINPGNYTVSVNDAGGNCTYQLNTQINPATPFTGTLTTLNNLICNGTANGTASISLTMGTGGTGNYTYNWSNAQTTPSASGLTAGFYNVTVTDANCVLVKSFQITEPPAVTVTVASANQVCLGAGANPTLQAMAAGGTGAFSYSWPGGITSSSFVAIPTGTGTSVYTVNVADQNGCSKTNTVQINFLASPTLAVQSRTICAKANATLNASGASNYTWSPGAITGSIYAVTSLTVTKVFTVTGTFTNGCLSVATATITVSKCTGIEEAGMINAMFRIYPNPAFSELFIETGEAVEMVMTDLAGQELMRKPLDSGTTKIATDQLKSGVYFVRIFGKGNYPVNKFVKLDL